MSNATRTEYRAYEVNGKVQGTGTNPAEALQDMAATLGEVLKDNDTPEGIDWYVLSFEQVKDEETGEWVDTDEEGELVSESPDDAEAGHAFDVFHLM